MNGDEFKFWAFVSHSHLDRQPDGTKWGDWLHHAIESFKIPRELIGTAGRYGYTVPESMYRSFLDKAELAATSNLTDDLRTALKQSRFMVVVCSPRSAVSRYVNQEVLEFKRMGRAQQLFSLVIDGEPYARDPELECFPLALRHPLLEDGALDLARHENLPLWVDLRGLQGKVPIAEDKVHHALLEGEKLSLFAGLLGISRGELFRRDEEQRLQEARQPGILNLDVKPVGASIEIAEARPGSTLAEVPTASVLTASGESIPLNLIPGVYALKIEASGFSPQTQEILIEKLHQRSLSINLAHDQGRLNAESFPLGSTIEIDGKGWGSPISGLAIDTGVHGLVAQADDCFESARSVEIIKDRLAVAKFWLEKGVKWKYSSSALQGGLAVLGGLGQTGALIAHNELSRIILLSTTDGKIKDEIPTPEGNRRAFAQIDLGGDTGKVVISGLDTETRGPDLLVLSSTVPPKVLWEWHGPASHYSRSSGLAVTAIAKADGVSDLAVAGRDGRIHILEGKTGEKLHDISVSDNVLVDISLASWKLKSRSLLTVAMRTADPSASSPDRASLIASGFDVATKKILWRKNFGADQDVFMPQPLFDGVPLMVLWGSESWHVIDASSGEVLREGVPPGPVIASPAIADMDGHGALQVVFEFADVQRSILMVSPINGATNYLGLKSARLSPRMQPRGPGNMLVRTSNGKFLIALDENSSDGLGEGLAGLDLRDGTIDWHIAGRPRGILVGDSGSHGAEEILVTMLDQGLMCVDVSGRIKWKLRLREEVQPWTLLPTDDLGSPPGILIHRHAGLISLVHRPSLLWRADASAALQATPVVAAGDDGRPVVVENGPWGNEVYLRGIDGSSGSVRWSAREQFTPNRGPALAAMDRGGHPAIVMIGSSPPAGGNRLLVYGADGALMRSLAITLNKGPWGGWLSCTPKVADYRSIGRNDVAVNNWDDRSIVLIDGQTGEIVWRHETEEANMGGVAAYDLDSDGLPDVMSLSFDGYLHALRGIDGRLLWKAPIDGGGWSVPVVANLNGDGVPYVMVTSAAGRLHVLDGRTGRAHWSPAVVGEMKVAGRPAIVAEGGRTIILAPLGKAGVVAFDWMTRTELWRSPVGFPVIASPIVSDFVGGAHQVVVGAATRDVFVLDLADGKPLWHLKLGDDEIRGAPIEADPVVTDLDGDGIPDVLVASHDFHLYAISGRAIVESLPKDRPVKN